MASDNRWHGNSPSKDGDIEAIMASVWSLAVSQNPQKKELQYVSEQVLFLLITRLQQEFPERIQKFDVSWMEFDVCAPVLYAALDQALACWIGFEERGLLCSLLITTEHANWNLHHLGELHGVDFLESLKPAADRFVKLLPEFRQDIRRRALQKEEEYMQAVRARILQREVAHV